MRKITRRFVKRPSYSIYFIFCYYYFFIENLFDGCMILLSQHTFEPAADAGFSFLEQNKPKQNERFPYLL